MPRNPLKQRLPLTHAVFGSRTDVGCVRERNEDSLAVSPPLFAVADGMGGHAAGDVASELAIKVLTQNAPTSADVDALGEAVVKANHAVINEALRAELAGMGTTMTACVIDGCKLAIAHVGDSRAYLLHHGKLQQLTRDHSLVADMVEAGRITEEEARVHPNRSIITRAIGSDPNMQPDLYEITASPGDRLLLCSDGLYSMVENSRIQSQLARIHDPQRCASALVNDAISAGGLDNITVVVVDIVSDSAATHKKFVRRSRLWWAFIIILLAAVLAGGVGAAYYYFHNSAYIGEQDGKVAVYQGVPGDFFGFDMSELSYVTDISVDDLQPGVQQHIKENIQVDNLDAANDLVAQYQEQADEAKAQEQATAAKKKKAEKKASKSSSSTSTSSTTATTTTTTNSNDTNGSTKSTTN
ncbi:MAG: Stp1/IreP family PP2C-type Ser/Thr phosphatase [Eggerthellaceae bacterium]|jgi:serine/threonine protein phosphatase PrpC